MFSRCMTHNKTVSSTNKAETEESPNSQRPSGVNALAINAEREEYRLAAATTNQMAQNKSADGQ